MFGTVLRTCVHDHWATPGAVYCSANTELVIVSTAGTIHHRLKRIARGAAVRRKRPIRRAATRPNATDARSAEITTHARTSTRCGGLTDTKPSVSDARANRSG